MAGGIRTRARKALELYSGDKHEEALACAIDLARANPGSALALNLLGNLHVHVGGVARDQRVHGGDDSASALEYHIGAALDAFSAAARIAPNCVLTAVAHAEALAAERRFAEAWLELRRVLLTTTNHADPAVNHVEYDLVGDGGSTAKDRKSEAVRKARALLEVLTATISEIVRREAGELLRGDAAVDQMRERAKLLSKTYRCSVGAQLLRVYIELEQARALEEAVDRKRHLRRSLGLIARAAGNFDSSLLIALFHAKVLFALDKFDGSEKECRRALRIETPTDHSLDDIPPAISVPGADYDARVSSLRKQLVRVDRLLEHYNEIDQSAAITISHAVRFLKEHKSWRFWVCPNSSCDGKKFVDTLSLCLHMRSKHQHGIWEKLLLILGTDLCENASKGDQSLDGITLSQDSGQHDIFRLPRVQDVFKSLLLSPSTRKQSEPLAQMQQRKCREGSEVLEDIKEKLTMFPEDVPCTELEEFRSAIQNSWFKFLETSSLDYREVILPLARSLQWIQMKESIDRSAKTLSGIIGGANIEIIFSKIPAAPDTEVDGLTPSDASNIDIEVPSSSETPTDGEKGEKSEVRIVQRVSRLMLSPAILAGNASIRRYHEIMHMVHQCLQTLQSDRQDGEVAFYVGVLLSNIAADMLVLTNAVNEASEFMNQMSQHLEMYGRLLGEGPVLVSGLIDLIKYLAPMMGTASTVFSYSSRACSFVGLRLQQRHPDAQRGGRETTFSLRSIVTVRTVEDAYFIIKDWKENKVLVDADIDEDMESDDAQEIYNIFLEAGAYDLIRDSSVLLSKIQSREETDWEIT